MFSMCLSSFSETIRTMSLAAPRSTARNPADSHEPACLRVVRVSLRASLAYWSSLGTMSWNRQRAPCLLGSMIHTHMSASNVA